MRPVPCTLVSWNIGNPRSGSGRRMPYTGAL